MVIVFCILAERFLANTRTCQRFHWFFSYNQTLSSRFSHSPLMNNSWLKIICLCLPLVGLVGILLTIFHHILFGFIYLVVNLMVFFYCLGPDNAFYPLKKNTDDETLQQTVGNYLAQVNSQLFAVIFWYMALGPMAVLLYRLVTLCQQDKSLHGQAVQLTGILDWIPARITSLLYLLAGNFQAGIHYFLNMFFTHPQNNALMLSECGSLAVAYGEQVLMPQAEILVEHAVVIWIVLLAFFNVSVLF